MLATWSLVPLSFLKPAWTSWFTYCWSLDWRILNITFLACEMSAIVRQFEHSLALPFFGIGMKTDLFQSCGHYWTFKICWHIYWSTLEESSLRIWNSSAGSPSQLPQKTCGVHGTLLLLLSRFNRVWLCASPWTAAHQATLSIGFSGQEHWSGLPFPSPVHESGKWKWSRSVVSDS